MAHTPAAGERLSDRQIADLFEAVAAAKQQMRDVLDGVAAGVYPVSLATIRDFEELIVRVRPAAGCWSVLSGLDVADLLRGSQEWARRRQARPFRAVDGGERA